LKFPTYKEAKREGKIILEKIATNRAYSLQLNNRQAQEYLEFKQKAADLGLSVSEAAQDWFDAASLLEDPRGLVEVTRSYLENQPAQGHSVQDSVESYLRERENKIAPRTYDGLSQSLTRLSESFVCRLDQLSRKALIEYIDSLRGKRDGKLVSAKTRNIHRECIRGFLKWCNTHELLSDSIYFSIIRGLANEKNRNLRRISIHTPGQFHQLMSNATGQLRLFIGIAAYTGLRTSEILKLEWSDIKSEYIEVRAENAKTRARRLVPIIPALKTLLGTASEISGLIWSGGKSMHRKQMAKLYSELGIDKERNILRHSFISYRLAETGDENQTAQEAGNTPDIIFQHYRELVTRDEAKEWFKILE